MHDPVVALRANVDQAIACAPETARLFAGYHLALREAGLPRDLAKAMTLQFQASVLQGAQS